MSSLPAPFESIFEAASTAPGELRVLVGAMGLLLLLMGARVYHGALYGSAGLIGLVLGAGAMVGAEQLVPGAATPVAMVVSAMVGGFFAMGLAKITHKTALLGVGAVVGGALGAAISAEWLEGAWWGPIAGVLAGGAVFPWVFEFVLKLVTPAVGAVGVAWALQRPDEPWVLGIFWAVGAGVQLGFLRSSSAETGSEVEG